MKHAFNSRLLSTSAFATALTLAFGASAQVVPNAARPTAVEQQNRIQIERPEVGGAAIISAPSRASQRSSGGASFMLKGINVQGATAISGEELKTVYADKLNSKVSLGELNNIAADITDYYRNKGYILTRAVVPPQRAQGGVFTIKIVEGFVNDVRLAGDVGKGNDELLQAYANKIKNAKPLSAEALERYLLLMEDLPGVDARAVLTPAAKVQGATDVVVTITRRPVEFNVGVDNRGTRYLGPVQANGNLFLNNLLGRDDLTQLRVSSSILNRSELLFGEVRHVENVGNEGTTVMLSANKVKTNPGDSLKSLDIKGESGMMAVTAAHPIIRSRRTNWFVNGDFTLRDVEVDTLGTSLYKDKTRVLNLGTSYDFVDSIAAINKADLGVAKGFNWGTEKGLNTRSRANGETSFVKGNAKLTRIQPLFNAFSLYTSAIGQYTKDPLLASEEMTIGGAEFGSAYDSAEISGDSGVAGRAELQFNQANPDDILSQYQIYSFYDIGKVWNIDPIAGSESSTDSLSSAGLGARFNILNSVSGTLEGAVPLTRNVASLGDDGDEARVFFNVQYRY